MKQILLLIIITLSYSCTEKVIQLPETTNQSITEVLDVSPVYMFYNEEKDSVEFNRKNMISTTNWLVNIDKRLTLKQILPHLQYLQDKRHGDGMHKNENARNYFTCNNTDLKNLSFIEFTDTKYEIINRKQIQDFIQPTKTEKDYLLDASYHAKSTLSLLVNESDNIILNDKIILISELKDKLESLKEYNFIGFSLQCFIDKSLSFQDYIYIKSELDSLKSETIIIDSREYIVN